MGKKKENAVEEIAVEEQALTVENEPVAEQTETLTTMEEIQPVASKKGKKKKVKAEKKARKPIHPLTITAFILSVVFFFFNSALIAPIIPIVLAIVGLVKSKKKDMGGKALGIVAIILSVFSLLFASGQLLVSGVKAVYTVWILIQGVISIFKNFDGNIFAFMGRIVEIVDQSCYQISRYLSSGLGIKTLYYYLNGMGDRVAMLNGYFEIFGIKIMTISRSLWGLVDGLYALGEALGLSQEYMR